MKFSLTRYPGGATPLKLPSTLKLKPTEVAGDLYPALIYCSPFRVINHRLNTPYDYDGGLAQGGNIDYPFMPDGEEMPGISRDLTDTEFFFSEESLTESESQGTETFGGSLYTSALNSEWKSGGTVPFIYAYSAQTSENNANGWLTTTYPVDGPFTPTAIEPIGTKKVFSRHLAVPSELETKIKQIDSTITASGKYSQSLNHIEDFDGAINVGGIEFYPPDKPTYYSGESNLGFDSGFAYDLVYDKYEVSLEFKRRDGGQFLTDKIQIQSVELKTVAYCTRFSGNNVYVQSPNLDQSCSWAKSDTISSNKFSEEITFSGNKVDISLRGVAAASRVIYEDEGQDSEFMNPRPPGSILTWLATGFSSIYMDRIYKITAEVDGVVSIAHFWFNLTPVVYGTKAYDSSNGYFPAWMNTT